MGREQGVGSAGLIRHADLALAAVVVASLAMMIVPLPPALLDLLVTLDIAAGVVLLLVALYVGDALKLATFPALLLLTTLFRLALEVAATRLVLVRADAGEVIRAFGGFVVAGNLVVGAVVFLILTVIQYLVISKGAERVAEVGARFALDAMPGKQLSIDAELRAGHIDAAEARRRRTALARESQLYGSMDGAMKFVKGDAVAGLVVLAVNIVGGLTVGILQRGMEVGAAVRTYTLLTIGEGLVTQIPALLISTAAGILVTRVASQPEREGGRVGDDNSRDGRSGALGSDIGREVAAHPKALGIAAALLAALALVPGLPALPFAALATLLGLAAWRLWLAAAARARAATSAGDAEAAGASAGAGDGPEARVSVDVSADLTAPLGRFAADVVPSVRARLYEERGIRLPAVRLRGAAPGLDGGAYVVRLDGTPLGGGELPRAAWGAGADGGGAPARVGEHLLALLRRHGHRLLGVQEAQALVEGLGRTHPVLVREVVGKLVSPVLLADVLKRLAREGISLRNLRGVLEALAERAPREADAAALTEQVRAALREEITHAHGNSGGDGGAELRAWVLDPAIEDTIREAVRPAPTSSGGGAAVLALEPALSRDILAAVARALEAAGARAAGAVLLTGAGIRRHVRRLVEADHPELAVLSYDELTPDARVSTVGRIEIQ